MYVLLPIKSIFFDKIINGTKKYEYRKTKPLKNINGILFYATSPIKKCVGQAKIKDIIEEEPNKLWEMTKENSGLSVEEFKEYYKNKKYAVAFKLYNIKKYDEPFSLVEIGINNAPQNFIYLDYKKGSKYIC